jgi:gliding motility-associated lipoprotein GldD
MKKKTSIKIGFILLMLSIGLLSCNDNYQPKPRGYFRIALPAQEYTLFTHPSYPFSFMMSTNAIITKPRINPERYWINITYPKFNAKIHISYKHIDHNLDVLLNDMHKMMTRHIPKANAINEQVYLNQDEQVYGMAYDIQGSEAASPYQFYLTDSTTNFVRGALYFEFTPNNDSLKPIINFLEKDMRELINSFRWENKQ